MMSVDARAALRAIANDPRHPRHEQACEYIENKHSGTPRQSVDVNTNAPITNVEVTLVAPDGTRSAVGQPASAPAEDSEE